LNAPYAELPSAFSGPGEGNQFDHHERRFSLFASRPFHSLQSTDYRIYRGMHKPMWTSVTSLERLKNLEIEWRAGPGHNITISRKMPTSQKTTVTVQV
jgi:hypothetical protein